MWLAPKIFVSAPGILIMVGPPLHCSCLWVVDGGGGIQDFSGSPSPHWVNLGFELGWDWVWGDLGLEGLGLGTRA